MTVDYRRKQTVTRFKNYQLVETVPFSTEGKIEINKESLEQVVKEVIEAAKADNYNLTSVTLRFKKSNKRRSKEQVISIYNW